MSFKLRISLVLLVGALIITTAAMADGEENKDAPQTQSPVPTALQACASTNADLQRFKDTFDYSLQEPLTPTHEFAGRVWLISYADGPEVHYANQNYLNQTAINKGVDFIIMYRKSNIDHDFYEANRKILEQPRGAGYWLWKPYFILKTLKMAAENDIVIYIDVGISLKTNIMPLLEYTKTADRVLAENLHLIRGYMKRDAVVLAGLDDSILDKNQMDAAVVIVKNTPDSRDFMQRWLTMCQNPRSLTDQPSEIEEYPELITHIHDQSLLTLLYIQNPAGTHIISDDEKNKYFFHHRRRPIQSNISLFEPPVFDQGWAHVPHTFTNSG